MSEPAAVVVSDPQQPQLGFFLRAGRPLTRGELVLRDEPLLRVRGPRKLPVDIGAAVASLRAASLYAPDGGSSVLQGLRRRAPRTETDDAFYVRTILHFNSFAAGVNGNDVAVFPLLARANHSCAPNCIVDGDDGTMRAIRDVPAGDELTISYLDDASLLLLRERRREELASRWDFHCCCTRCCSLVDDTRRFRSCKHEGCDGELVGTGHPSLTLTCSLCSHVLDLAASRALLQAESAAASELKEASSGDLEEEDQGQALIRCYRFASKHPTHSVAMELASEFEFPDAVEAKRLLLDGWLKVFSDVPGQLLVDVNKELARMLQERGKRVDAQRRLQAAAEAVCVLDGREDVAAIVAEWKADRSARRGPMQPPAPKVVSAEVSVAEELRLDPVPDSSPPPNSVRAAGLPPASAPAKPTGAQQERPSTTQAEADIVQAAPKAGMGSWFVELFRIPPVTSMPLVGVALAALLVAAAAGLPLLKARRLARLAPAE